MIVEMGQKLIAGMTLNSIAAILNLLSSLSESYQTAQRRPMAMSLEQAPCLSDEMGVNTPFLDQPSFGNLSPHHDPRGDMRAPQTTGCKTESSPNILRGQKP